MQANVVWNPLHVLLVWERSAPFCTDEGTSCMFRSSHNKRRPRAPGEPELPKLHGTRNDAGSLSAATRYGRAQTQHWLSRRESLAKKRRLVVVKRLI